MFDSPILTTAGLRLLNRAITGEQLLFTSIKMGKGDLGDTDLKSLTDLVDPVLTLPISSIRTEEESATVSASFANKDLTQGFLFKEIGLFAKDPGGGEDILYCYQQAEKDTAEYMAPSSYEIVERVLSIVVIIGTAQNVSAVINHSLVFVTHKELRDSVFVKDETLYLFSGLLDSGDSESSGDYDLPIASKTSLGAVRIGDGISISEDGTISVDVTEDPELAAAIVEAGTEEFSSNEIEDLFNQN